MHGHALEPAECSSKSCLVLETDSECPHNMMLHTAHLNLELLVFCFELINRTIIISWNLGLWLANTWSRGGVRWNNHAAAKCNSIFLKQYLL